jgi:hydroxyacyl-ACP dehydratase HTD2-like protein with hotdog domain
MAQQPYFEDVAAGDALPSLRFGPLSVIHTVRWAGFTENWYRLHYDRDFVAAQEGEPRFIASGGFRQALLCRMLTDWLGRHGRLRRLTVRQLHPTYEGDLFICQGRVAAKSVDGAEPRVTCEVWATNGEGREVLRGTCVVSLPRREDG